MATPGGSTSTGSWLTPVTPKPGPASPAPCGTDSCAPPVQIHLADKAGAIDGPLDKAVDFHSLAGAALAAGPVVLQVHANDPSAACGHLPCDSTMVVDAVVWDGDAATAPGPYSIDDVTAAITEHLPDTSFQAIGTPIVDCGTQLLATTLLVAAMVERPGTRRCPESAVEEAARFSWFRSRLSPSSITDSSTRAVVVDLLPAPVAAPEAC